MSGYSNFCLGQECSGAGRFIKKEILIFRIKCCTHKKACTFLSGFASADNGLISINALSDEAEIIEAENDSIIKLFKEGTLGRLLIGYGGRRDGENFIYTG